MRENSPIKKRILQIIDLKEITRYEFYKKSGIARGILDQNNGISEENISKFLEYMPDISTHWLLTGQGSMLNTSSTQINGSKNIVQSGGTENSAQIIGGRKKYHKQQILRNQRITNPKTTIFLSRKRKPPPNQRK